MPFDEIYTKDNTFNVGRSGSGAKLTDELREGEPQFISRVHAQFISLQSGIYINNIGRTGTLVNGTLLEENQWRLLKHNNTITFGRDNTAPGQMQPYDGLRFRVEFPDGPGSIGAGRRTNKREREEGAAPADFINILDDRGREVAVAAAAAAHRLLGGLGRASNGQQVRGVLGTAVGELQEIFGATRGAFAAKRQKGAVRNPSSI